MDSGEKKETLTLIRASSPMKKKKMLMLIDDKENILPPFEDHQDDSSDFESCPQFVELMSHFSDDDDSVPPQYPSPSPNPNPNPNHNHNPNPNLDHNPNPSPLLVLCPLCNLDISTWDDHSTQLHVNACLDNSLPDKMQVSSQSAHQSCVQDSAHVDPVVKWLRGLGLSKYEEAFIQQEIDLDSLQCLTEEDIVTIGVTALGPRKKILQSIKQLRERNSTTIDQGKDGSTHTIERNSTTIDQGKDGSTHTMEINSTTIDQGKDGSTHTMDATKNRLITEFFSCPSSDGKKNMKSSRQQLGNVQQLSRQRRTPLKKMRDSRKKDIPSWCCIPGTPFRVDAFQYLQRDCSHWFLTHFHVDHYQGLTRSFTYGKLYCSLITAKLINAKIGIPWDLIYVMPLNKKLKIAGVDVTCFDANHCPGAIMILFEPPNGKAVLHTGDFRFNEEMACNLALQANHIHTLILDTTYCNPQYNFPKQEIVLQFVIEAIQAESFNPKTLFLIGSYTIGKERLFLEVARVLRKKIYVNAAKLRVLECLELPAEDMQWFTLKEVESHIHVVPMWTIASFKRLKQLSYQYSERFSLIVAFTPTGLTFGKGKKSAGKRWQQGTIIRYEVPYSEHCSFEELKEFVKLISPVNIVPSVNNESEPSANAMTALLLS